MLAGPGFIPPGAPLKPPPAPLPRGGARSISFDLLTAFDYDPEVDVIPDEIEALHGTKVELLGVMYYAVDDVSHVDHFYLMPNHYICCFGTPRANDVVEVDLRRGTSTQYLLTYFLIRGRLEVGAVRNEEGEVLCLYRIPDAQVEVME